MSPRSNGRRVLGRGGNGLELNFTAVVDGLGKVLPDLGSLTDVGRVGVANPLEGYDQSGEHYQSGQAVLSGQLARITEGFEKRIAA